MEDTCSPGRNKVTHTFRIYSIVIPIVCAILLLEIIYVIASVPSGEIGSALTIHGSLPKLPPLPSAPKM